MNRLSRFLLKLALHLLMVSVMLPGFAEESSMAEASLESEKVLVAEDRDPFWPVGYWPKPDEPEVVKEEVKTDGWMIEGNFSEEEKRYIADRLKLRGVMERGGKRFAVLDSKLAGVGDVLSVKVGEQTIELELTRFDGKTVVLSSVKKNVVQPEEQEPVVEKNEGRNVPTFRALP